MAQESKYKTRKKINELTSGTTSSTSKQPSAEEIRQWWEDYAKAQANFDSNQEAVMKLTDVTKSTKQRGITRITKENLRTYLENPSNYESMLRDVSRYLATRCQVYYRLIKYNANIS